jgi:hypothetical protein
VRKLFGEQLDFVARVLSAKRQPVDAGMDEAGATATALLAQQYSKVVMQVVVSVIILAFSFYLLTHSNEESGRKAAFGFIGTVLGYWLR